MIVIENLRKMKQFWLIIMCFPWGGEKPRHQKDAGSVNELRLAGDGTHPAFQ